jgi:hypothetical protein
MGANWSWAAGNPVYIFACNGTAAQAIGVHEIDGSHDVTLHAGTSFCVGVRGGGVAAGSVLELQTCIQPPPPAQRFAFDGDTLFIGRQASGVVDRSLVIETQAGRGYNWTPLVVGTRDVTDSEYFRFLATDGTQRSPHSGFFRVTNEADLDARIHAGWGTVVEIDPTAPLHVSSQHVIARGTTVRGYRHAMVLGAEILATAGANALAGYDDNIRVTGLRLVGNDPAAGANPQDNTAISLSGVHEILVDNNELLRWNEAAVYVDDGNTDPTCNLETRWTPVHVVRKLHSRQRAGRRRLRYRHQPRRVPVRIRQHVHRQLARDCVRPGRSHGLHRALQPDYELRAGVL